jgi:catechol 2,3-dioxygenase-like lactoylglutathione lyase family enzyme
MASAPPTLGRLWNIGAKVADVAAEAEFLGRLGGRLRMHETLPGLEGPIEYAFVDIGSTRLLLTPTPVYEQALGRPVSPGLAHAVFEVTDHTSACRAIEAAGARQLTAPRRLEAGFGTRDVAFFESPGGILFEALHIISDRLD